jgi:hypothetical protein
MAVITLIGIGVLREGRLSEVGSLGLLLVVVGWCVSLSNGYPIPALVMGPLAVYVMAYGLRELRSEGVGVVKGYKTGFLKLIFNRRMVVTLSIVGLLVCSSVFYYSRVNNIYRDLPARDLDHDLGDVLKGADGIKTNENTYMFFKNLNLAIENASERGKQICIVPEVSVYWVESEQRNPLSTDWPNDIELSDPAVRERVIDEIDGKRGSTMFIVQKFKASTLSRSLDPFSVGDYSIVDHICSDFNRTGENEFFYYYE